MIRRGKVERIEFTHGSFGNQFTTISGKRYMTWFDLANPHQQVHEGCTVEFEEQLNTKVWDYPPVHADVAANMKVISP